MSKYLEQKILLDNIVCIDDGLSEVHKVAQSTIEADDKNIQISISYHIVDLVKKKTLEDQLEKDYQEMLETIKPEHRDKVRVNKPEVPVEAYSTSIIMPIDKTVLYKLFDVSTGYLKAEKEKYVAKLEQITPKK